MKINSNTDVSCGYCNLFKNSFLKQHLQCLLLRVRPRYIVKSAGVPVLWFHASKWLRFWSKTFTKPCTNISLLSLTKQFLGCLNLLVACFWFQNMFWKNINCFRFWWKTFSSFFACTLRLVRCFQFQGMIWKTEECLVSKSIALKTWRWKSQFLFSSAFVYFSDLRTMQVVLFISALVDCFSSF